MASGNLLRIPDKDVTLRFLGADCGIMLLLEYSTLRLSVKKATQRNGTRVPCAIPITLRSLDPAHPFSKKGEIILVNLRGCAARVPHAFHIGSTVELQGLPMNPTVTARVVNCISVSKRENLWLLALELDEPGNVWGIQAVPADWIS